ncbi:hypothetical protein OSG_eHP42_00030 [environmental Halophage eHP-42]|nr:hypothetical protein OSG_eHP42_00030 [environmental Halophage eHP-42]
MHDEWDYNVLRKVIAEHDTMQSMAKVHNWKWRIGLPDNTHRMNCKHFERQDKLMMQVIQAKNQYQSRNN